MTTSLSVSWLEQTFWLSGFVVEIVLVSVLIFREQLKGISAFLPLIAYGPLFNVVLFVLFRYGTKREYFWVYWIGAFASDPLEYWLLVQVVRDALRPLKGWGRRLHLSMWSWGCLILVVAGLLAAGVGGPAGANPLELWEIRASLFSDTILCCMLTVLATTVVSHGSLGRPHLVAISRGLIVWSYSGLIFYFVQSIVGWGTSLHKLEYVRKLLYVTVEVYWIVIFWKPEKPRPPLSPDAIAFMQALHNQIKSELESLRSPE